MAEQDEDDTPLFSAVSNSARHLYLLLRCINFADKAHVHITEDGLRFSVDESSVMEGYAFLDKALFTSYHYRAPHQPTPPSEDSEDDSTLPLTPTFQISLPSLLETLQIFSLTDTLTPRPWSHSHPPSTAFSAPSLGLNNLCRIIYAKPGAPLTIILTESTITTTCALTTYAADHTSDIPFARNALPLKIIMRASWLADAIHELASTGPDRLLLVARTLHRKPYFALSGTGSLGSARVEFTSSSSTNAADTDSLLETFQLGGSEAVVRNSYKFGLIQKAARAMGVATKVSVRCDGQGVLSLQFMIEVEAGKICFVDFRFVPFVGEEGEEGEETMVGDEGEDGGSGMEDE